MTVFLLFKPYFFSALLIVAMFLFMAVGSPLIDLLRFDRMLIAQGEIWRLFSAHFVHLSWPHTLGNSAGLLLANYIAGRRFQSADMSGFFLFSVLLTGGCLWLFAPDLNRYVGLSGVLHGLLIWSMVRSDHYSRLVRGLFLLVVVIKILWEQTTFYNDLALQDVIGGRVEARAHLYGLISVLIWLAVSFYYQRKGAV